MWGGGGKFRHGLLEKSPKNLLGVHRPVRHNSTSLAQATRRIFSNRTASSLACSRQELRPYNEMIVAVPLTRLLFTGAIAATEIRRPHRRHPRKHTNFKLVDVSDLFCWHSTISCLHFGQKTQISPALCQKMATKNPDIFSLFLRAFLGFPQIFAFPPKAQKVSFSPFQKANCRHQIGLKACFHFFLFGRGRNGRHGRRCRRPAREVSF